MSDKEWWVYKKGKKYKKTIRDIAKQVKFSELKDEGWIVEASKYWRGITDEMRKERWYELKNEKWICHVGYWWSEITDEMCKERFKGLKDLRYILMLSVLRLPEEDRPEFDYFYQNLSMSYGLLKQNVTYILLIFLKSKLLVIYMLHLLDNVGISRINSEDLQTTVD